MKTQLTSSVYVAGKLGKKGTREIEFEHLSGELRTQFEEAMLKGWTGWLTLGACEVIPPHEAHAAPMKLRVPCRFVLTDERDAAS